MIVSVNDKVICKPYEGKRKIDSQVVKGLATVKQKNSIVGLQVIADAKIGDFFIHENSVVYVSEEFLFNAQTVLKPMECEAIDGNFILMDFRNILFVKAPNKD